MSSAAPTIAKDVTVTLDDAVARELIAADGIVAGEADRADVVVEIDGTHVLTDPLLELWLQRHARNTRCLTGHQTRVPAAPGWRTTQHLSSASA